MDGQTVCYSSNVTLTELLETDLVYTDVAALFGVFHTHREHDPRSSFVAANCIKRMFRVNNPMLLKQYADMRQTMNLIGDGPDAVKEEDLFHASPRGNVDSILHYGFVSPTKKPYKYGFSICFARRSKKLGERTDCTHNDSELYPLLVGPPKPAPSVTSNSPVVSTRPMSSATVTSNSPVVNTHPHVPTAPVHRCRHYMFLCKVLVGDTAMIEHFSHLASPPIRPNKPECLYDSCEGVGSTTNQVAIYDTSQAYPLYLIEYDLSCQSETCDKEGVAGTSDAQPGPSDAQPGPSVAQPGPSVAQPRPYDAQPGPSVAQPRPSVAQPGPSVARPGPSVARPGPSVAQPRLYDAQPRPSDPQPGPSVAQPGPSVAQPRPYVAQPGSSVAQPGPSVAQPGPYVAQPGPSVAQPGPSVAQPRPYDAQPGPSVAQPGPSVAQPRPYDAQPGPSVAQPRPSDAQPGPSDAQPRPSDPQPGPSVAQPGPSVAQPGPSDAQPLYQYQHPFWPMPAGLPPNPPAPGYGRGSNWISYPGPASQALSRSNTAFRPSFIRSASPSELISRYLQLRGTYRRHPPR